MEHLVIDSNVIIRGAAFDLCSKAKEIVTIQEVLEEIRDSQSRDLLLRLPYEIVTKEPSIEACNHVAKCAVKTGDFAQLSKTDMKLIALTYMLHQQYKPVVSPAANVDGAVVAVNEQQLAKTSSSDQNNSSNIPVKNAWSKALKVGSAATIAVGSSSSTASAAAVEEGGGRGEGILYHDEEAFPVLSRSHMTFADSEGEEDDEEDEEEEGEEAGEEQQEEEEEDERQGEEELEEEEEVDGQVSLEQLHAEEKQAEVQKEKEEEIEHIVEGFEEHCSCHATTAEATATTTDVTTTITVANDKNKETAAAITAAIESEKQRRQLKNRQRNERRKKAAMLAKKSQLQQEELIVSSLHTEEDKGEDQQQPEVGEDEDNEDAWITAENFHLAEQLTRWNQPLTQTIATVATGTVPSSANNSIAPSSISHSQQIKMKTRKTAKKTTTGSATTSSSSLATADLANNAANAAVPPAVACMTSDYSMQHVLLHLSLPVLSSLSSLFITSLRSYVMYCNACYRCYAKPSEQTLLFCPTCGARHLSRVAATIEPSTGSIRPHLKKGYLVSAKGSKYSLPAPGKQPRFMGELLLRGDQLSQGIWKQRLLRQQKEVKAAFGDDGTGGSDSLLAALHLNKSSLAVGSSTASVKVGWKGDGVKHNPNARKGRERRGAKRSTA